MVIKLYGRDITRDDPSANATLDHARQVIQKSDGGYALFGSTFKVDAKGDFYLVKTDCVGDVCMSGTLNLSLVNPSTLSHTVNATEGNGPDEELGDPELLRIGTDYEICPGEEESTSPSPGEGVDLSWLMPKK